MLMIFIASTIGIISGLYIDFYLCIALLFVFLLLGFFGNFNKRKILIFIMCVISFYVYTNIQINMYDNKYKNGEIVGNFKIISYKEDSNYYDKYIAKSDSGDKFLVYLNKGSNLKKGSIIQAIGEFSMPDESRNSGGFNYRRYLNSQNIFGSIFIKDYYVTDLGRFNLIYFIQDEIYNSLGRLFPQNEMGLVLGMMIGETKDISDDVMDSFRDTGITHLVAVSGSNVMYVLTLVEFIFKKIVGKRNTYFISIVFIIIFMLISGASSSVVRASIMTILGILANVLYFKSDIISNISFSGVILMIVSPLIIFDIGFILSFGGTLGIVLLSKDFQKLFIKFGKLSETLGVTASAQIILMPIMMYFFNTISILSIIANLIVVPISGSITILGFVIFIISKIYFPLAKLLSNSLYLLANFTILVSKAFSKIPFANLKVITPNIFEIVLFYFVIFYLAGKIDLSVFKREKSFKFIGRKNVINKKWISFLLIFFICIEIVYYNFTKNYIDIACIDVGQGDAIFIKTNKNRNILIDGGGSKTYDVGSNILMPYLLDRRVCHIDTIISSHSDADHLNGILTVLENFSVSRVIIGKNALGYEKLYEIARKKNVEILEVSKGNVIKIDDVLFEVIWPDKTLGNEDVNAYSLVVKLVYYEKSMLFTGDINKETEAKLQNVKSDILKVAHHGSDTSSDEKFLAKVKPIISIIQVGKDNDYGHPDKNVLKRLEKFSKIYTTAECGEIRLKIYRDKILTNRHITGL